MKKILTTTVLSTALLTSPISAQNPRFALGLESSESFDELNNQPATTLAVEPAKEVDFSGHSLGAALDGFEFNFANSKTKGTSADKTAEADKDKEEKPASTAWVALKTVSGAITLVSLTDYLTKVGSQAVESAVVGYTGSSWAGTAAKV